MAIQRRTAAQEAATISSGTLSYLIGSAQYQDVDSTQRAWVLWIDSQPEEAQAGWAQNWRRAWAAFRAAQGLPDNLK